MFLENGFYNQSIMLQKRIIWIILINIAKETKRVHESKASDEEWHDFRQNFIQF